MDNKEMGKFELILKTTTGLPMVKINRDNFLEKELIKYYPKEQVREAVENNPAYAGIELDTINKIADSCINYETRKYQRDGAVVNIDLVNNLGG